MHTHTHTHGGGGRTHLHAHTCTRKTNQWIREFEWMNLKLTNVSPVSPTKLIIPRGGARGVIVIVVGNEHGDTSSNPGRNSLHFT